MIHKIASVQAIALAATWDKVFGSWERVPQSLLNPAANQSVLPQPELTATMIGGLMGRMLIGQDA